MARPIEPDLSATRGGQRVSPDPERLRRNLVRLGRLDIRDFLLLDAAALARVAAEVARTPDLALAFNNVPDVLLHLRRADKGHDPNRLCDLGSCPAPGANGEIRGLPLPADSGSARHDIESAQSRLTRLFALELLQPKAPPLFDALPWHDWDFSIVARRFKLWQTRFLLAGAGTGVTMCHCRKSAGVFALEPHQPTARYVEAKAALEKVRRFRLLPCSLAPSIPLSPSSVDLAILASSPSLQTATCKLPTQELTRIARNVLIVENSPLSPPLDPKPLIADGFTQATVQVRAIGPRPCWWHLRD